MARANDTFVLDDMDDAEASVELNQDSGRGASKLSARRSLELYLEKKALRGRLQDTFNDRTSDLDELGW